MSKEIKQCIKCGQIKPLDAFRKGRNQCKECCREGQREYQREYRQRPENKERKREGQREYDREYSQRPEVKERNRERKREYNQRPEVKERQRERQRERQHEYYQLPETKKLRRIHDSNRRARKRSLPNTFTPEQWERCLNYFHGTCAVCAKQLNGMFDIGKAHADHFIPLSYEGDDNPGTTAQNMLPLCKACNLSKSNTMPDEWLISKFGKRKAKIIEARVQEYFDSLADTLY